MKNLIRLAALGTTLALGACAHTIVITPDVARLQRPADSTPSTKNVGYYISAENRALKVTTPGGGGDKVSYQPYKDIEPAIYTMLDNVFANVTQLNAPDDAAAIARNNVAYIVKPELVTNSSSDSSFTWPPTNFTVDLTCTVVDAADRPVAVRKVSGEGKAEFSEFKNDLPLSGKRAVEDAVLKMQAELLAAPELR